MLHLLISISSNPNPSQLNPQIANLQFPNRFHNTHLKSLINFNFPITCGMDSLDQVMDDGTTYQAEPQKPVWCERKQAIVQEEIRKMNQLPAKSTYVAHRLKVLNKILQLMSVQRTVSQEKELELLFAGLSL